MDLPLTIKNSGRDHGELLQAVAQDLKLPLLQITRCAELANITKVSADEMLNYVKQSADSALDLIDSYTMGLQLAAEQQALSLEPISAASVVYDVAHKLDKIAKRYDVEVELQLGKARRPVMANQAGLSSALLSLGTAFIEAVPHDKKAKVTLATHATTTGLATGIYSEACDISSGQLRAAGTFYGKMRQPFGQLTSGSTAGIFVAQQILQAMAARLKVAKHNNQSGLAAVLQLSRQLSLV